jgi:hypothetical protein
MQDASGAEVSGPRPPSFLGALAPVVVLIALLTLTIILLGTGAADGPLQGGAVRAGTDDDQHRGHLHGDGDRLRVVEWQRDDRGPVLAGRHLQHA